MIYGKEEIKKVCEAARGDDGSVPADAGRDYSAAHKAAESVLPVFGCRACRMF